MDQMLPIFKQIRLKANKWIDLVKMGKDKATIRRGITLGWGRGLWIDSKKCHPCRTKLPCPRGERTQRSYLRRSSAIEGEPGKRTLSQCASILARTPRAWPREKTYSLKTLMRSNRQLSTPQERGWRGHKRAKSEPEGKGLILGTVHH